MIKSWCQRCSKLWISISLEKNQYRPDHFLNVFGNLVYLLMISPSCAVFWLFVTAGLVLAVKKIKLLWQVTAYGQMIYISPRCVISCPTHIYSVPFTHNTTLTPDIYFLYLVTTTGRFCELRPGFFNLEPRWAWRSLITNLQLPEITKGGESSNWRRKPIAFLIKLWPRCERYSYEEKI